MNNHFNSGYHRRCLMDISSHIDTDEARDRALEARREANTCRMWIMDPAEDADPDHDEGKILITVETRQDVCDRLLSYLGREDYEELIPDEVAPPNRDAPAPPVGPRRPVLPSSGIKCRRS